MAEVNRVELTLESIPATIHVAEEDVDKYLANGWERVHSGGRRRAHPATGSTPTQNPNQNR